MLDKLILNSPDTLEIKELGITIKVREPTRKEKLIAKSEAMNSKGWSSFDENEKAEDLFLRLLPSMIVEPKITYDDINAMPESTRAVLIKAISEWWVKKIEKYKADIANF
jgi:hypothetical protein